MPPLCLLYNRIYCIVQCIFLLNKFKPNKCMLLIANPNNKEKKNKKYQQNKNYNENKKMR